MKLSCPAHELARTLDAVVHVVRTRPTSPILGYLLLQAEAGRLTLTATDLEVGVRRLRRMGLPIPAGLTKREASALIDEAMRRRRR